MPEVLFAEKYFKSIDSEWVVFIHGAGGSSKTWKRQIAFFSQCFNLLLIDLRDHGNSKNIVPDFSSYNFEMSSNDLLGVLDYHQIEKASFVTLSFGSVLIQDFIKKHPQRVNKLVFTGAVLGGGWLLRSFIHLARFLNIFLSYSTMYKLFSFILMPRKENQLARRLYMSQAKQLTQEEYLKWLGLYDEFFKLLSTFKNLVLNSEAMIVMGSQDFMFLKSASQYANNQPKVQMKLIEGAGHIVNIEKPESFNQLVFKFLESQKN